jgi:hypothetical protein
MPSTAANVARGGSARKMPRNEASPKIAGPGHPGRGSGRCGPYRHFNFGIRPSWEKAACSLKLPRTSAAPKHLMFACEEAQIGWNGQTTPVASSSRVLELSSLPVTRTNGVASFDHRAGPRARSVVLIHQA